MEEKVRGFLNERFGETVKEEDGFRGQQAFRVPAESLVAVCEALLNEAELAIKYLADLTVVDWLDHPRQDHGRYEVVYNLCSLNPYYRFLIKVRVDGDPPSVPTLCDLWPSANWMEREAYDLFGIEFEGHPNLTKILTPDDLDGHPLRKDFPLTYEQPRFTWNKDDPPEVIK